ncbi:MAG: hypothetical protein ACOC5T_07350 [Elusimicrobiota bacterium]
MKRRLNDLGYKTREEALAFLRNLFYFQVPPLLIVAKLREKYDVHYSASSIRYLRSKAFNINFIRKLRKENEIMASWMPPEVKEKPNYADLLVDLSEGKITNEEFERLSQDAIRV